MYVEGYEDGGLEQQEWDQGQAIIKFKELEADRYNWGFEVDDTEEIRVDV